MLKIALTKGRVERKFIPLLEKCGINCQPLVNKQRRLIVKLADKYEFIFIKGPDAVTYLNKGVVDLGIVGSDVLMENQSESYELLDLKTGKCQFILASTANYDWNNPKRKVIGTKYPTVAQKYFLSKGEDVEIIKIEGSVELTPLVGLVDVIVDITETGTTLRENHLIVHDYLDKVSIRLVANPVSLKQKKKEVFAFSDMLAKVVNQ
ncbi:ATP phosphoribosyltransferase [Limosilactobacillus reuteri]|uniref:ATP phosphoribosyltransferase n=1 Tax=Limosilactobacillus reuteri TaxID=1598 RepID=A0ABD6Y4G2_LIMRT|nr:ATP phosphoribosyltransferase [Limosilactobacillus reuteri]PWT36593.1 ATP phosphoribosyltransferase [Limosilactobacillus reuteri]